MISSLNKKIFQQKHFSINDFLYVLCFLLFFWFVYSLENRIYFLSQELIETSKKVDELTDTISTLKTNLDQSQISINNLTIAVEKFSSSTSVNLEKLRENKDIVKFYAIVVGACVGSAFVIYYLLSFKHLFSFNYWLPTFVLKAFHDDTPFKAPSETYEIMDPIHKIVWSVAVFKNKNAYLYGRFSGENEILPARDFLNLLAAKYGADSPVIIGSTLNRLHNPTVVDVLSTPALVATNNITASVVDASNKLFSIL